MALSVPIIDGLLDLGNKLVDKLIRDPSEKAEAKYKLLELAQNGDLAKLGAEVKLAEGQMQINLAEANSPSLWKGGWRPFIGWICGVACGWNWVGLPIALFICKLLAVPVEGLEPASLMEMMPVLLGMLGLGTLRTYERKEGVIPPGK